MSTHDKLQDEAITIVPTCKLVLVEVHSCMAPSTQIPHQDTLMSGDDMMSDMVSISANYQFHVGKPNCAQECLSSAQHHIVRIHMPCSLAFSGQFSFSA